MSLDAAAVEIKQGSPGLGMSGVLVNTKESLWPGLKFVGVCRCLKKFHFNLREDFSPLRVAEQWDGLVKQLVESYLFW